MQINTANSCSDPVREPAPADTEQLMDLTQEVMLRRKSVLFLGSDSFKHEAGRRSSCQFQPLANEKLEYLPTISIARNIFLKK